MFGTWCTSWFWQDLLPFDTSNAMNKLWHRHLPFVTSVATRVGAKKQRFPFIDVEPHLLPRWLECSLGKVMSRKWPGMSRKWEDAHYSIMWTKKNGITSLLAAIYTTWYLGCLLLPLISPPIFLTTLLEWNENVNTRSRQMPILSIRTLGTSGAKMGAPSWGESVTRGGRLKRAALFQSFQSGIVTAPKTVSGPALTWFLQAAWMSHILVYHFLYHPLKLAVCKPALRYTLSQDLSWHKLGLVMSLPKGRWINKMKRERRKGKSCFISWCFWK